LLQGWLDVGAMVIYHYQHQLGRTSIAGLLFVNFYIYIFNHQRFRAGQALNSSPAASPARQTVKKPKNLKKTLSSFSPQAYSG
jgi:hypothetical protein